MPQLPTTLPTLDELIGREDLGGQRSGRASARAHRRQRQRDQVFTLHAELEGGAYLQGFERLLVHGAPAASVSRTWDRTRGRSIFPGFRGARSCQVPWRVDPALSPFRGRVSRIRVATVVAPRRLPGIYYLCYRG